MELSNKWGWLIVGVIVVILIVMIFISIRFSQSEKFNIPKPTSSEYVPQNMSFTEFKTINRWDYPGYLNAPFMKDGQKEFNPVLVKPTIEKFATRFGKNERFDSIYPGGRGDVNCVDADYMGAGGQCDNMGPYIQDPIINL